MATWGTEISENDTYLDVKSEFLEQLNKGKTPQQISDYFLAQQDLSDIAEESHDWVFAVADFFWKTNNLDNKLFTVVKKIITSKADLDYWEETAEDDDLVAERAVVLSEFLNKIKVPIKKSYTDDDFYDDEVELTSTILSPKEIDVLHKSTDKKLTDKEKENREKIWENYTYEDLVGKPPKNETKNFWGRFFK